MSNRLHVERLLWAFTTRRTAEAIRFGGRTMSYADLDVAARALVTQLIRHGVTPGERVVAMAHTSPQLVALVVACHLLGATLVPINPDYRQVEVAHILADCRPALIVTDGDADIRRVLEHAAPIGVPRIDLPTQRLDAGAAPRAPAAVDTDTALIIYTSGTTGPSKGAELSHRAVVSNMVALMGLWQVTRDDKIVLALPLFHVHGLCLGVYGALLRGATILLQPRFDAAAVVSAFEHGGATMFMGVPTMYRRLLDHLEQHPEAAEPLRSARLFTSGSAALSQVDFVTFEHKTGQRIVERYGMTETLITLSNPVVGERRPGSVGTPLPGVEARVADDDGADVEAGTLGELLVRGESMMTGYFGQPEATRSAWRDGWFRTGDIAIMAADGYVQIVGRRDIDIIKRGGYKIAATEVEAVLCEHDDVTEAAVVGVPDRDLGERVVAVVVAQAEEVPALRRAIAEFLESRLAAYKCPSELVFVRELPRNAMGKLQKHRVRELVSSAVATTLATDRQPQR